MPTKQQDFTNRRFGRLLALKPSDITRNGRGQWECVCDCGKVCLVIYTNLRIGKTRSCGCLNMERITKHGLYRSRIYGIWRGIKSRCFCKNNRRYKDYGGRGIKVCERWLNFENFYNDVSPSHTNELSFDRYPDNDGDYCPENFRWATKKQQSRNTRTNRILTINGLSKSISEWSEITGVTTSCISTRLKRKYSQYEAVFGKNKEQHNYTKEKTT